MSELIEKAERAGQAARKLVLMSSEQKNQAIHLIASELMLESDFILTENQKDLTHGKEKGLSSPLLDRLTLTPKRLEEMAQGLIEMMTLPDPIGETLEEWEQPNGLHLKKVRVPLGVIGMIYEARPNVTVDASCLCLKSGNAVLLRGSSSALFSNKAIVAVIHRGLEKSDLPFDAVQLLEDTRRETAVQMFRLNDYLDVLIPRGGANLIQTVVREASVPVLETGVGNCHIFIDASADPDMAISIAVNAKTQRPSVCNAAETLLVHEDWARHHLSALADALQKKGVSIRADNEARHLVPHLTPATEVDWETEYLDLVIALRVVTSLDEAIDHIQTYGTKHSEAIVSENQTNVETFFKKVDAAALYHNASTRFTDGHEFGFGAEIGISTQNLHARGPMGLPALTSTKYLIYGKGQIRT
jgi:glutamate-5-semialdehyde dehydrogenase